MARRQLLNFKSLAEHTLTDPEPTEPERAM
jgi:hypothetical protein